MVVVLMMRFKLTDEHKEKDRIAHLGKKNGMYGRKGIKHPNYGKHLSEETKKKMTVEELVRKFTETGEANDRVLLH